MEEFRDGTSFRVWIRVGPPPPYEPKMLYIVCALLRVTRTQGTWNEQNLRRKLENSDIYRRVTSMHSKDYVQAVLGSNTDNDDLARREDATVSEKGYYSDPTVQQVSNTAVVKS